MKKIMLLNSLLTLLSHPIYAETTNLLANATPHNYAAAPNTTTTTTQKVVVPANTTTTVPATTTTTVPVTTPPQTTTTIITTPRPATTTTTTVPTAGTTSMTQPMNCHYHIPPETTHVENAIVMAWADNATRQSFDLDHVNITQQLANLRPCYTDQGWQSFNDALNKSGNLSAIQTQKLMVASKVDGNITVTALKENQWRANVPLQVIYQNERQKLTQLLTVDLVIGRKINGDLGIMQMIASPRQAVTTPGTGKPAAIIIHQPASLVP